MRILNLRKSGRPDLRWGRAREGVSPGFGARGTPFHKGEGSPASVPALRDAAATRERRDYESLDALSVRSLFMKPQKER